MQQININTTTTTITAYTDHSERANFIVKCTEMEI